MRGGRGNSSGRGVGGGRGGTGGRGRGGRDGSAFSANHQTRSRLN